MNDNILTLYYYSDGLTAEERRQVESELGSDPALAARYNELRQQLDDLSTVDDPVAPPHLVARWHDLIDQAAEPEKVVALPPRTAFHFGSFFWGAAVAASLAVGVAIGIFISGEETVPVEPYAGVVEQPVAEMPTAFSRGLLVHFRDSRDRLSELDTSANGERDQLILNIIQQNRLFALMAKQNDSPDLARVLRAFEPILVRLSAEDISPEQAAKLQSQLAFEINIVLTKLARQVSDNTDAIDT